MVAVIAAGVIPAAAADNDGVCNTGERCGWRDSFENGSLADYGGNDVNFTSGGNDGMYLSGGILDVTNSGDRISSVENRETVTIWWHADSNCGGDDTPLAAGADLDTMPGGAGDVGDNEASSEYTATSC
ncbi:MAG TPA: hypothetical protein VFR62_02895 [Gemmatimonadales bacterium]|nr:hypothetical protein [Gemmatimonadales bacterium]